MLRFLTAVLVLMAPLGCSPARPPGTYATGAAGSSHADHPRPSHGRKAFATTPDSATVDMTLDHNRTLVDGEIQRGDGTWRGARLWVDTGNPDLFLSERLARDLGLDLSGAPGQVVNGRLEVPPPAGLRLGKMALDLRGVKAWVVFEPAWLFSAMHNDANLPATVLRRYQVVLDYPRRKLTIARPGAISPRGVAAPALIHPQTGIVQLGAVIAGDTFSFALDNGASYSFTTTGVLKHLSDLHPEWPTATGALGAANIWGWWPQEESWPVMRVPEIRWGGVTLSQVGLVGLGEIFGPGFDLGAWYSEKTARPVDGFLGPNAFKSFRVEIDYPNNVVYFEKGPNRSRPDMDLLGLTLRPEADGGYSVIGVAQVGGESAAPGIQRGDRLIRVDGLDTRGATMGTVVDALRGEPGEVHVLVVERDGRRRTVEVTVHRFLPPAPRSDPSRSRREPEGAGLPLGELPIAGTIQEGSAAPEETRWLSAGFGVPGASAADAGAGASRFESGGPEGAFESLRLERHCRVHPGRASGRVKRQHPMEEGGRRRTFAPKKKAGESTSCPDADGIDDGRRDPVGIVAAITRAPRAEEEVPAVGTQPRRYLFAG